MKKIISQVSLVLLIITIGMISVFITEVRAESIAGLKVSSATVGGELNVSLILPSNAYGAQCTITVTYSDGSQASQVLVYAGEYSANTLTFPAKVAGTTVVRATNINIVDGNVQALETNGSKEQTVTIASNTPTQPPEQPPAQTQPPAQEPAQNPSTPSTSTPNTSDTTTTKKDTENEKKTEKEPEIVNPTFKDVNETVYVVNGCNVRSSCSTEISSNKIGGLVKGQAVTRTGIEGTWSRIKYNGKTAYVATRLLTTEKPVEEEPEEIEENKTLVNNTVSNETETNNVVDSNTIESNVISNEQMLNQIEQEIGVLPEVGHNIATILFVFISILTLIIVMSLQYKTK